MECNGHGAGLSLAIKSGELNHCLSTPPHIASTGICGGVLSKRMSRFPAFTKRTGPVYVVMSLELFDFAQHLDAAQVPDDLALMEGFRGVSSEVLGEDQHELGDHSLDVRRRHCQ